MVASALDDWHRVIETQDFALLDDLIADDAVFLPPNNAQPEKGKAAVIRHLKAMLRVPGNDSFRYNGAWEAERSAVLGFACEVDGVSVDGADFLTWDENGKIVEFKLMVRPSDAIDAVASMIADELMRIPG